jgi:hypothetical protein
MQRFWPRTAVGLASVTLPEIAFETGNLMRVDQTRNPLIFLGLQGTLKPGKHRIRCSVSGPISLTPNGRKLFGETNRSATASVWSSTVQSAA